MVLDHCEQGTPEWMLARAGIPSASEFDKIMTPTGKKSTQFYPYMYGLIAEWLLGRPKLNESFGRMEYGKETEQEARDNYEFITGNSVEQVGFVYKDEQRMVGCSPDGLCTDMRRGVEIKCPDDHVHMAYFISGSCPSKYLPQVQGSMYVTGYKEWDFMSYHPELPPLIVTVKRDVDYIKNLNKYMTQFISEMTELRNRTAKYRRTDE